MIALGVDAAAGDPESPLRVTADGLRAAGRELGALGLPTVVVQEGGYDLATIGALVRAALEGLDDGLATPPGRAARRWRMADPLAHWVGRDESEGIPVQPRKDVAPPPHWRLEAIAATERPRSLTLGADRRHAVFIQDRDTSDVWLLDLEEPSRVPRRLTDRPRADAVLGGRRAAALARRRARSRTPTTAMSGSWRRPAGRRASCSRPAARSGSTTRRCW